MLALLKLYFVVQSTGRTSSESRLRIFGHGVAFIQNHKLELVAAEAQKRARQCKH